jgi:hypothetical protein
MHSLDAVVLAIRAGRAYRRADVGLPTAWEAYQLSWSSGKGIA